MTSKIVLMTAHGTWKTQPKFIYEGEHGFDMKFLNNGMWGRGLYFAKIA